MICLSCRIRLLTMHAILTSNPSKSCSCGVVFCLSLHEGKDQTFHGSLCLNGIYSVTAAAPPTSVSNAFAVEKGGGA